MHPETLLSSAPLSYTQSNGQCIILPPWFKHNLQENKRLQHRQQAANKHHHEVSFDPADWVMLSTKNLDLPAHASRKLSDKYIGPYQMLEKIGNVAHLLLYPATCYYTPSFMLHICGRTMDNHQPGHHSIGWQENPNSRSKPFFDIVLSAADESSWSYGKNTHLPKPPRSPPPHLVLMPGLFLQIALKHTSYRP